MAQVALEVNGAALVGASAQGVLFNEPGVALVEKRRVRFGREAAAEARLNPGQSYENYWELLSNEPLPRRVRGFRSYADLAHGQLREFRQRFGQSVESISGVILVVPAGVRDDRLALLLGIAEEAQLPIAGLVESGVAAVRGIRGNGPCLHIETTAERIVVTRLEQSEGRITSEEILFNGRPGLRHLRAAMTAYAASRFVASSRFDPLDLPSTEQQMANQLEPWLEGVMSAGELEVELSDAPIPATAVLNRQDFMAAVERQLAVLGNRLRSWCTGPQAAEIQVSGVLAAAPGCAVALSRLLSAEAQVLQPGASALGALARFRSGAKAKDRYVLLRSLPAADVPGESGSLRAAPSDTGAVESRAVMEGDQAAQVPTHLVQGGRAWRINALGLRVGSSPHAGGRAIMLSPEAGVSRNHCTVVLENGQAVLHDHSRYGTRLNGAAVAESAPLRGGDVVGVGPVEFLVACEVGGDGS